MGAALGLDTGIGLHHAFCESNYYKLTGDAVVGIASFTLALGVIGSRLGSAIHRQ